MERIPDSKDKELLLLACIKGLRRHIEQQEKIVDDNDTAIGSNVWRIEMLEERVEELEQKVEELEEELQRVDARVFKLENLLTEYDIDIPPP